MISHQPWCGWKKKLVYIEALGHITYWKIKKQTKNNKIYAFISGYEPFDNFLTIASFHGHLWPRTVAIAINCPSDQLLKQETIFRMGSGAIDSSNQTPCKSAKNATFWESNHLFVHISTYREVMQCDVWWSWQALLVAFTSKYEMVNAVGHIMCQSRIDANFGIQSRNSQERNAVW